MLSLNYADFCFVLSKNITSDKLEFRSTSKAKQSDNGCFSNGLNIFFNFFAISFAIKKDTFSEISSACFFFGIYLVYLLALIVLIFT